MLTSNFVQERVVSLRTNAAAHPRPRLHQCSLSADRGLFELRRGTGIDAWTENGQRYSLNLQGGGLLAQCGKTLRIVCDYLYATLSNKNVREAGHTYGPEDNLPDLLAKAGFLGVDKVGLRVPQVNGNAKAAGYLAQTVAVTLSGDSVAQISIPKEIVADPRFMLIINQHPAVDAALALVKQTLLEQERHRGA